MKKLLALLLCVVMMLPAIALAADDGRIHITYSFWGNQTEAESVQAALDTFNAMQDKIFVEPMQIPTKNTPRPWSTTPSPISCLTAAW